MRISLFVMALIMMLVGSFSPPAFSSMAADSGVTQAQHKPCCEMQEQLGSQEQQNCNQENAKAEQCQHCQGKCSAQVALFHYPKVACIAASTERVFVNEANPITFSEVLIRPPKSLTA
ncbi:hypothetical protein CWI84_07065 [Idiomarina tyrosinivorans]|uniref:DUF2946 domain-containing protein n=1 Tax=Idiomarina tyrosinivorans TaxID=1445662 RepID=A0A432ZQ99_9GAMM|nr:hypothetical protein [Idiomarina tyrosinivorans]RUO80053.1 hypothetical protein CWI84_07065 [Idiomarina tyrosinivorans]